jgi:MFS family permease
MFAGSARLAAVHFGYATLSGLWALLIARLMWGLSFAAMNIATQALATAEPAGAARRSGRMRAIIAAGPVSGLIVGAVVSHLTGPREAFLVLSAGALVGFLFAAQLPRQGEGRPERLQRPRFGVPSRLDTWSFIQGMTLDGLFVLGISILASAAIPGYATLAAGGVLALRYVAEITLGPSGGALAQRYGPRRVLTLLVVLNVVELIGVTSVGPGFWSGFAVTALLLVGYVVHLRNASLADARTRRIAARRAAVVASVQAEIRAEQARRLAARREALRRAAAARSAAQREAVRLSQRYVDFDPARGARVRRDTGGYDIDRRGRAAGE